MYNLSRKERELLNDLLTYSYRLNEYLDEDEYYIMLDNLIMYKIDSISPYTAYKMLNYLQKNNILNAYPGTEVKVINYMNCDLSKERLSLLLLERTISSNNINFKDNNRTLGLNYYINYNKLNYYVVEYPIMNYLLILDQAESFIGRIYSDDRITESIKNDIINKFIFLYRDLELDLYDKNLTKKSTNILANRFDAFSLMNIKGKIPQAKDTICIEPFNQEINLMLNYDDDKIIDQSLLIIGKHYLDNILNYVSDNGLNNLLDSFEIIKSQFGDLSNSQIALNYINQSINERLDKQKEKSYGLSHNFQK